MADKKAKKPRKRKTIKDVAAEANVSISTVSLALNGTGYVSADTRKRVIETAARMGYVPQAAAKQLASRKTGNIGFVLRANHFARSEPFYTHVFLGAEFEADRHDLYVLLATIPETYTPVTDTPRFLRERNVDGILVAGKVDPAFIAEVEEADIPIVLIDFEVNSLPIVAIDNQAGARTGVEHLIELGHKRIAFAGADISHPALRGRLDGYRLAMATAHLPVDTELLLIDETGNPTFETGQRLGNQLLQLEPRPTAAFCVNDAVAMGVLDSVSRAGLNVPRDLSLVGFDDVVGAASLNPPLTTVRVFKQQLGELAVRYLENLITARSEGDELAVIRPTSDELEEIRMKRRAHNIHVPVELVVRSSTTSLVRDDA